jgi:hypothetical protein
VWLVVIVEARLDSSLDRVIVADWGRRCSLAVQTISINLKGMRILFIPLMLMVAVVVALALMSTAPRSSPQSGPRAVQSVR